MDVISPLHGERGRELLDTIDKLRRLPSISHEIALPQIVVVGHQSSGKSSVLRAISKIDFPISVGLSTRFATEIICRREKKVTTKVSIIPHDSTDEEYCIRLREFTEEWSDIQPDQDLSEIFRRAAELMGLDDHKKISKDKLRLEFSGPKQDHISLIDLPGLFGQALKKQQKTDPKLVSEMVKDYIKGEQTIILAVVSGTYDIEVQTIFDMFAPHQHRTLGVITSPDMVPGDSPRAVAYQKLVANDEFRAGHNWYVLRNLSHQESQEGKDRDEVETKWFADWSNDPDAPWAWRNVPKSRLGIGNLKQKLASLLKQRIIEGLPQVQGQLNRAHQDAKNELDLLGQERTTAEQQRDFLADRSEKLRALTAEKLKGGQGGSSLRSKIRNANDRFADDMIRYGAHWKFISQNEPFDAASAPLDGSCAWDLPVVIKADQWLQHWHLEISNSRGLELDGLVDPVWVGKMFLKQSRKWKSIAESHADETYAIVMEHFDEVIQEVVERDCAGRFLQHAIHPELQARGVALKKKVVELLAPYTTKNIRTLNRGFCQGRGNSYRTMENGFDRNTALRSSIAHYTYRMFEYYDIALDVFVDNMESLAVENVLLNGLEDIMTANKAHKLDESKVAALVAESEDVTLARTNLLTKIQGYEEGLKIVSQFVRSQRSAYNAERPTPRQPHDPTAAAVSAPTITVIPAVTTASATVDTAATGHDHTEEAETETSSTETLRAQRSPGRRHRKSSIGGSSRGSSTSRVFTEHGEDDEENVPPSGSTSLNTTPAKTAGSLFNLSSSTSANTNSGSAFPNHSSFGGPGFGQPASGGGFGFPNHSSSGPSGFDPSLSLHSAFGLPAPSGGLFATASSSKLFNGKASNRNKFESATETETDL